MQTEQQPYHDLVFLYWLKFFSVKSYNTIRSFQTLWPLTFSKTSTQWQRDL